MVLGWYFTKIVKKDFFASQKDKKDWSDFTKDMSDVSAKEHDLLDKKTEINKIKKLDLHGLSLEEANKESRNFINECFNNGYKKILIVTGKGSRSKTHSNPYLSEKLSVLKYSVPEYLKNEENLSTKINKISWADQRDGGEGAIYIYLKKNKNL